MTAPEPHLDHPRTRAALRNVRLLAGVYLLVSVLTLVAIVLLSGHPAIVNDAVWVRGTIVTASAALTFVFASRAARGSRRAYLRLRLISAIMAVAIVVIISLPGTFPLWMKIEQAGCGLVLLAVVAIANSRGLRALFAAGG
jgi:O-antigen/teichoic acid export membrane protein